MSEPWISVNDRLPEGDKCSDPVWAWVTNLQGKYGSGAECVYVPASGGADSWEYPKGWYFRNQGKPMTEYIVTHWMPLVEGPKP
jgi:hypothetical protein